MDIGAFRSTNVGDGGFDGIVGPNLYEVSTIVSGRV
jgi:hypothetical protein